MKRKRFAAGYAWAWAIPIDNNTLGICHWAYPSRQELLRSRKPDPDAWPVYVKMHPRHLPCGGKHDPRT